MKPGALPRGNPRLPATARTSRRTATRALHTRAQPSSRALRPSMLRARDFLAQPSQQPAHIADTQTQHLPSISSLRIARPISHARACLEPHVPPRQTVDLPRPLSPDAQPCLSNCALLVRQSAPVLMRARPHSTQAIAARVRPVMLNESAEASSRASPMGAGTYAVTPRMPAYKLQGWLQCSANSC